MDGWMDIIRVGVCVGMCKYWVIILDILAYGGAKCFRGMNPSLILLTSISHPSCRPSFFSSSPPTTHHPFIIHHASRYLLSTRTTMAHHGSTGLTILLDRVQATIEYTSLSLSHSLYQNDRCPCNELTVGPASLPSMESACNPTRPGRPRPRRATKTRSTGWWTAQCCRKSFPMLELCDTTMNRRGLERKQATTE